MTMSAKQQRLAMRAILIGQIISNGTMKLTRDQLDSGLGRLLTNPEFRGLGINLRMMRELYLDLFEEAKK